MRRHISLFFLFIFLFAFQQIKASAPVGALMMPIEFQIENGDFNNSIVDVKKDGVTVLTKAGQHNLKLRLQYGSEYLLSFSKPGYITKKILVNTAVAADHGKQGFEPYKIGVKIFKQYEGVNIVVYNQPVALINYHNELDEFGYDTDYTRSILSLLTETEKQLEQKAKEEREQMRIAALKKSIVADPVVAAVAKDIPQKNPVKENIAEKEKDKSTDNSSVSTQKNAAEKKSSSVISKEEDKKNPHTGSGSSDLPPANHSSSDKENPAKAKPADGENPAAKNNSVFIDKDTVQFSDSKNLNDLPVIHVRTSKKADDAANTIVKSDKEFPAKGTSVTNGNDVPKISISSQSDKDFISVPTLEKQSINRTVEKTVEANRVITTIRLAEGDHITEYRHIVYNWGGEYFFVNKTTPISEHMFDVDTGE